MKRPFVLFSFFVPGCVLGAGTLWVQARGIGTPEQRASQLTIEAATTQLEITEEVLPLTIPGQTMAETAGSPRIQKVTCSRTRAPAPAALRARLAFYSIKRIASGHTAIRAERVFIPGLNFLSNPERRKENQARMISLVMVSGIKF
jgi:hypothetical protein